LVLDLIRHTMRVGAATLGAWSYQPDCEGMFIAIVLHSVLSEDSWLVSSACFILLFGSHGSSIKGPNG
jgi:hypothetical protein